MAVEVSFHERSRCAASIETIKKDKQFEVSHDYTKAIIQADLHKIEILRNKIHMSPNHQRDALKDVPSNQQSERISYHTMSNAVPSCYCCCEAHHVRSIHVNEGWPPN